MIVFGAVDGHFWSS